MDEESYDSNERETPLWERVKNLQEGNAYELKKLRGIIGEALTLMTYNYGPSGKCVAGLVNEAMGLKDQIITVLEHYHEEATP